MKNRFLKIKCLSIGLLALFMSVQALDMQGANAAEINSDLIGYFRFDNGSLVNRADVRYSGVAYTSTNNTISNVANPEIIESKFGQGLKFSGELNKGTRTYNGKDYANVPSGNYVYVNPKVPIYNPGEYDFTASIWVKFDDLSYNKASFIAGTAHLQIDDTGNGGWSIQKTADNKILLYAIGQYSNTNVKKVGGLVTDPIPNPNKAKLVASLITDKITDTNWHNITMVIDRQNNKLLGYLDGDVTKFKKNGVYQDNFTDVVDSKNVPVEFKSISTLYNQFLFIGGWNNGNVEVNAQGVLVKDNVLTSVKGLFKGSVDELRIYNVALTSDTIQKLYDYNNPPKISVTGMTLQKTKTYVLLTDKTKQLVATITPADADELRIIWTSSNENILKVDNSGLLIPIMLGTAQITATTVEGNFTATCKVDVTSTVPPQLVESIKIDANEFTFDAGRFILLAPVIYPTDSTNQALTWVSSNNNVASVVNGKVIGISAGEAVITATAQDGGGAMLSCKVVILSAPSTVVLEKVVLNKSSLSLNVGETQTLTIEFTPLNTTNQLVSWAVNDSSVISVVNGTVTAIGKGTAIITMTSYDGLKEATCQVTVK